MEQGLIDYSKWDFSGKGSNLLHLFKDKEKRLWKSSFEYQDTRRGEKGHAEVVTYLALRLLEQVGGDREVVVPAAMLHDIGWSQLTNLERELFYVKDIDTFTKQQVWKRYEPILRSRHQEQGVILARKLLDKISYPSSTNKIKHICEIISKHDTREGFYSSEDEIVRSADMMWRYTLPVLEISVKQRGWSIKETKKQMEGWLNFFSSEIRKIVRVERKNTFKAYSNVEIIKRFREERI